MPRLMSVEDWKNSTSAFGKPRSKELKAVDEALARVEQFGGGDAQWRLEQALNAWKAAQGPGDAWKKSVRNKKLAVERLTALLKGEDSETAWGRNPAFMKEHLDNARLGVLYFLGHLDCRPDLFNVVLEGGLSIASGVLSWQGGKIDDGGLGKTAVDTAQNFYNTAIVPGAAILQQAGSAAIDPTLNEMQGVSSQDKATLKERALNLFGNFVRKTGELLKDKFSGIEMPAAAAKSLVNLCCKLFLSTLQAGLVSGAIDTFKGLVNVADASITRIRTYMKGRGVSISAGHPSTVVNSIKFAMNANILEGLWTTLKGAANIGLAFATWGTAMIVSVVVAIFEMVVKVIYRIYELLHMRKIFSQAASYWAKKDSGQAFHKAPFAFNDWFRKSCAHHPILSILTLNSGICGDKMVWLNMYQGGDFSSPITSEQFLKGAKFLDSLKPWGSRYISSTGFAFRAKSPQSKGILELALGHKSNPGLGGKIWGTVVTIANA